MSLKSKMRKAAWTLSHGKKARRAITNAYKQDLAERDRKRRLEEQVEIIRNSDFFDADWYIRNHIELQGKNIDPAEHYLTHGASMRGRSPSPIFSGEEYYSLNWDVYNSRMNPLLHYELHGKNEGREIYERELKDVTFPVEAESIAVSYRLHPAHHKRIAVLSCFFSDGVISDSLIYEIKGLREVVDNIILVGDCPIAPSELSKLDGLVCAALFERHEQYDFGSYKRGLAYARENDLIEGTQAEELVFINDSCFGPVYPFKETFDRMSQSYCDFWGYANKSLFGYRHIQSFFICFKREIIISDYLDEFLSRVDGKCDRGLIIVTCESQLTKFLVDKGFLYSTIVNEADNPNINIFANPVTFLRDYRVPLVKKKAFQRKPVEDLDLAAQIIRENAPILSSEITISENGKERVHPIVSLEEHRKSFDKKAADLAKRIMKGHRIHIVFMVTSMSMFSARELFDCALHDDAFEPQIVIIPDFRKGKGVQDEMQRCIRDLMDSGYPRDKVTLATADELGRWEDACGDADIVCYSLPYYQITSFRYCPYYAIGHDFLPVMVNYGYYRSKYDRRLLALDVYNYVWMALFENDATLEEYRSCSKSHGQNAVITGYVKMDGLSHIKRSKSKRTCILVALHHSIDGGANDWLALANFIRYFDYLCDLPDKYPEIDFIYRPHPYLIDALRSVMRWDSENIASFIAMMAQKPNVVWSSKGDYFQEFADSDACIQDCGSFLVEYVYTGKPCCYMLKSHSDIDAKFAPLGKACLEQCYLSYSTDDIDHFIQEVVVAGKDPKASGRAELAKRVMVNYPHAAEAALQEIKDAIMKSSTAPEEEE